MDGNSPEEGPRSGWCLSCGFLAKAPAVESKYTSIPPFQEIAYGERDIGGVWSQPGSSKGTDAVVICFRLVPDFVEDLRKELQEGADGERISQAVIRKDRDCCKWYPYTPGFTPKEHLEELKIAQLERMSEQTQRMQLRVAVGQAVVSVVAIVAAVVLAMAFAARTDTTVIVPAPTVIVRPVAEPTVGPDVAPTGQPVVDPSKRAPR